MLDFFGYAEQFFNTIMSLGSFLIETPIDLSFLFDEGGFLSGVLSGILGSSGLNISLQLGPLLGTPITIAGLLFSTSLSAFLVFKVIKFFSTFF